jgi:uncharacterized membrane protein
MSLGADRRLTVRSVDRAAKLIFGKNMNESAATNDFAHTLNGGMVLAFDDRRNGNGFLVERQYSTSFVQRVCVYFATVLVILAIGSAFAYHGAWPVLLLSVVEVGAILYFWIEVERHKHDRETVVVDEHSVEIVVCRREFRHRYSFNRYWSQLVYSEDGEHVVLRSHGRQLEIGLGLSKQDKQLIFRYLAAKVQFHRYFP